VSQRRLWLNWRPEALEDLEKGATARQAQTVVDAMESMARSGWSLGRSSEYFARKFDADVRYWPVRPLGTIYRIIGQELRVLRIVDGRRLRQLP
jgi:hypothetical protein